MPREPTSHGGPQSAIVPAVLAKVWLLMELTSTPLFEVIYETKAVIN